MNPADRGGSSLRLQRIQARAPRVLAGLLLSVLCIAGTKSLIRGQPPQLRPVSHRPVYDLGAAAFAQSFAAAYLTWSASDPTARANALKPFLSTSFDPDAGMQPARGSSETVQSTEVAEQSHTAGVTNVVLIAQTSTGIRYLSVPVARDPQGLLYIRSYPAFVGPPASDPQAVAPTLTPIDDAALQGVLSRALGNYLSGQAGNLRADLAPSAAVSLPSPSLTMNQIYAYSWLVPGRTVSVRLTASDQSHDNFTLTYQMTVVKQDRWYVQSIQFDPTLAGGA
ncbi:MAG: conjugal transfer protein [Solirubrobacteraceae bacterium]